MRRLLLSLYLAFFAGGTVMAGLYFMDTRQEYLRLKAREDEDKRKLDDAQMRLQDEQKILERLRTDPEFVERKIREKLGYAKPDESVFRFEP